MLFCLTQHDGKFYSLNLKNLNEFVIFLKGCSTSEALLIYFNVVFVTISLGQSPNNQHTVKCATKILTSCSIRWQNMLIQLSLWHEHKLKHFWQIQALLWQQNCIITQNNYCHIYHNIAFKINNSSLCMMMRNNLIFAEPIFKLLLFWVDP